MDKRFIIPAFFLLSAVFFLQTCRLIAGEPLVAEKYQLVWDNDRHKVIVVPFDGDNKAAGLPNTLKPFVFGKININQADSTLLQTIPGIGPSLAARIIETRRLIGRFTCPDSLLFINGVGEKRKKYLSEKFSFEE